MEDMLKGCADGKNFFLLTESHSGKQLKTVLLFLYFRLNLISAYF